MSSNLPVRIQVSWFLGIAFLEFRFGPKSSCYPRDECGVISKSPTYLVDYSNPLVLGKSATDTLLESYFVVVRTQPCFFVSSTP